METYILKISLTDSPKIIRKVDSPKVIREIEVTESSSLHTLAEGIIRAYDFDFDHCFGFFSNISEGRYFDSEKKYELFTDFIEEGMDLEPTGAKSVKKTKIKQVWKNIGDKMLFLFDYGDNWHFIVELVGFGEKRRGIHYPRILKKIGKAPRQY